MARSDFNRIYYPSEPLRLQELSTNVVAAGGSVRSTRIQGHSSTGSGNVQAYLYTGASFADGSASIAVSADDGNFSQGNLALGVILRMQTLGDGLIAANDRDFYIAGIYIDNTNTSPVNLRLYRVLNGTPTQIGSAWSCPVVDNTFIQFELQLENDMSDDVICRRRQNEGSALSSPGSAGWTSYTTIATDTGHGGVLNQAGYAGFGKLGSTSFSGGANNRYWVDDFLVTPVIQ